MGFKNGVFHHMKIVVPVKRVMDPAYSIRLDAHQQVDMTQAKMIMNPFDEIAMEEAVRLKEKGVVKEIISVSIGSSACQDILRTTLAFGADRAILIETIDFMEPLNIAKILKAIVLQENPELVLMGKQAIDTDDNEVGQMLAGLLRWAQGTFASSIAIENNKATVTREIDGGLETLLLTLPAVITSDLRLNEPRYLSLPNIMQAKRKRLDIIPLHELSLTITSHLEIIKADIPQRKRAHVKVNNVKELLQILREKERVIS